MQRKLMRASILLVVLTLVGDALNRGGAMEHLEIRIQSVATSTGQLIGRLPLAFRRFAGAISFAGRLRMVHKRPGAKDETFEA